MSEVLAVIDMQDKFFGDLSSTTLFMTINNVVKEIRKAKKNSSIIAILEYINCGETHPAILREVEGYDLCYFVRKGKCDGSKHMIEKLRGRCRLFSKITSVSLCGIFLNQCVYQTLLGLIDRKKKWKVSILKRASTIGWSKRADYSWIRRNIENSTWLRTEEKKQIMVR